jgi:hypothetical protein
MSDALNQSKGNVEQTEKLISILCAAPSLMRVLDVARTLDLPDWLVFSGAVYQRGRSIRRVSALRSNPAAGDLQQSPRPPSVTETRAV